MTIKERLAAAENAFGGLKALGRDPSTLQFDNMKSPTEVTLEGRPVTLFGTNNYLGLTYDEGCMNAASEAVRAQGTGTTGSRIANGSYASHTALEREIASFYDKRYSMLFSTGYLANLGMLSVLGEKDDYLVIDSDSHASIYDGCKMSSATVVRFHHNSPESLAKRLKRLEGTSGDKIIVIEGMYSMLGDTAPIDEFVAVKKEAADDVYLLVDEAHSLGVFGTTGRGKAQADNVDQEVDFIVGTFSKSAGTTGGFCVSNLEGFNTLRFLSRPYMFTASMTPSAIATAQVSFEIIASRPHLKQRLWKNSNHLYHGAEALGFKVGPEASPIVAIILPDPASAVVFWNRLIDEGIYTNIAIPPATPGNLSLLRVSVSAAHTEEQIIHALNVMESVGIELGLIEKTSKVVPLANSPELRVITADDAQSEVDKKQLAQQAKGTVAPNA